MRLSGKDAALTGGTSFCPGKYPEADKEPRPRLYPGRGKGGVCKKRVVDCLVESALIPLEGERRTVRFGSVFQSQRPGFRSSLRTSAKRGGRAHNAKHPGWRCCVKDNLSQRRPGTISVISRC